MRALLFDGGLAGAQLAGDLLVEKTCDDARQHVSLTGREGRVATTQLGALAALRADRAIALDRVSNGVEQVLLAERLRQKLHRTGFHGPDRHGDVAVAGEEDDRQRRVRLGKLLLEIQPAQPRQAHVEHETARRVGATGTQECLRAGEDLAREPYTAPDPPAPPTHAT